jgi:hypothetical protein
VAMATRHRNLKTIVVSAPADMAGPPPSITKKKKIWSKKPSSLSARTAPTCVALQENPLSFISTFSFYLVLRFLCIARKGTILRMSS